MSNIHERFCPLPHSATPPSIPTHITHTHNTLRNVFNMVHVSISTHIPWRNMLAAFLQCMCMRLLYPRRLFPLPAPLRPTPLSPPINETMAHFEDGKRRSANTNMKSNTVSKRDLECCFEAAKNIFRSFARTWRSAFDWLNIVSKSSNNRQQKKHNHEIQWRFENDMDCRSWSLQSIFRSTCCVFPVTFVPKMSTISLVNECQWW